jgi:hypothetical protein
LIASSAAGDQLPAISLDAANHQWKVFRIYI